MAGEDNSLATDKASVAGTVEDEVDPVLASTTAQGAKTLLTVDVDADALASMEDSICNSSSSSSLSSLENHPDSSSAAPLEDMEMEPLMKNPTPMLQML